MPTIDMHVFLEMIEMEGATAGPQRVQRINDDSELKSVQYYMSGSANTWILTSTDVMTIEIASGHLLNLGLNGLMDRGLRDLFQ